MMTKQQEREILAKIEKLIASAGEDSYIAAAFYGCVDLAHDNIQNDFCINFPDKLSRAEHDRKVLGNAVDEMAEEIRQLKKEREQLQAELIELKQKKLPHDLYRDLWLSVENNLHAEEKRISEEAELLSRFADAPHDIAVSAALKRLATAKSRRDECADLLARLERHE